MSENDRVTAILAARLLTTHRAVAVLNLVLLAVVLSAPTWLNLAFLAVFIYAIYLHIGLEFDARIFMDFAQLNLTPRQFDDGLKRLKLKHDLPTERTLESRCLGALAKFKLLLVLSVVLLGLAALKFFM